jgi:hypothetical protein
MAIGAAAIGVRDGPGSQWRHLAVAMEVGTRRRARTLSRHPA